MKLPNVTEAQLEEIQFLPNPVGSGKTQAAIEGIKLREDECHIFVSPTVDLAQEIYQRMKRDLAGSPLAENLVLITNQHKARGRSVRKTVLNEMRSRFNNVAALATCLPPTWVKDTIIRMLGTNGTEFYKSWRLADTYQTIGRCSIRVRESQAPITLIVLSEEEATALGKLFPGSKLNLHQKEHERIRKQVFNIPA